MQNIDTKIRGRFDELTIQLSRIDIIQPPSGGKMLDNAQWQQWATSALNLLQFVFGKTSAHYENFKIIYENHTSTNIFSHERAKGVFLAAKDDYLSGFATSIEVLTLSDVLGDFINLAKEALAAEQKNVAAVLASAALEDAIKRYCILNDIEIQNKELAELINLMKAKGLLSGAQKSLVEVMPRIRNSAMHADWDKIRIEDIASMIGFLEQFLLTKFQQS